MSNSSLVILAERDILKYLNNIGVFPSEFYTDFESFKERLPFFINVSIVIMFTGGCSFSQKRVLETVRAINNRIKIEELKTINDFYVLSDYSLVGCEKYYRYDYEPLKFVEYNGRKITDKTEVNIWDKLDYNKSVDDVKVILENHSYSTALETVKGKKIGTDGRVKTLTIPQWRFQDENSTNNQLETT